MKPGYKTSEFWLTVLSQLFGALLTSGLFERISPAWGPPLMLVSKVGYDLSRGLAKKSTDSMLKAE